MQCSKVYSLYTQTRTIWIIDSSLLAFRELFKAEGELDRIKQAFEESQLFEAGNQVFEEAKGEIDGFFAPLWGKICLLDKQCVEPLAHCVTGHCRPSNWVWSGIAISLISGALCLLCALCGPGSN